MQRKSFALFLEDIWGEGVKLMEGMGELGLLRLVDHSNSKVMSSTDHRALLNMRVAETSPIAVGGFDRICMPKYG